ncbi:hypothetical protein ACQPXM_07120 [Kribbella sp. CA-253562]|uniref:hypothetical protein n=1 Tax=Kribbella sp. CA-253562 TaxID=3239942 RepID=UPI003D9423A7
MGLLVWRCFVAAVGLLGLVAAAMLWTTSSLIGLPLVGGFVASTVLWCAREDHDGTPAGRKTRFTRSVRDGYLVALGVVAVGGLCSLLGVAGLLVAMLLGLASPPVLRRIVALAKRLGWGSSPVDEPKEDTDRVRQLTTAELCSAWILSGQQLRAASSSGALPLVRLRQLYLDELERRDPVGFNAWLASTASAAGDPRRFLTP